MDYVGVRWAWVAPLGWMVVMGLFAGGCGPSDGFPDLGLGALADNGGPTETILPDFDSLVLAHDDRGRLIDDAHRPAIYLSRNLRVLPTFTLDGRIAGTWQAERKKAAATLVLAPFAALGKPQRASLEPEALGLLRFLEPGATSLALRID